jgi:hypothetical protein
MDADAAQNCDIASEYSVTSHPTLIFFPRNGSPFATELLATDISSQKAFPKYNKHPIAYESLVPMMDSPTSLTNIMVLSEPSVVD